jgi:hypothetical protein
MNLVVQRAKVAGVVTVKIEKLPQDYWATDRELDMLRHNGDVTIALGGTIPMSSTSFALDARSLNFPSQLPFIERFEGADNIEKATAWAVEVNNRIRTAMLTIAETFDPEADSTTVVPISTTP